MCPGAYASDTASGIIPVTTINLPPSNFTNATTHTPWVVSYIVTGPISGLTATAFRSLSVIDPCAPAELTCIDTLKCSVNGQCGLATAAISALLSSLSAPYSATSTASSSSGSLLLPATGGAVSASGSLLGMASSTPVAVPLVVDTTPPTIIMLQGQYPTQSFVTEAGGSGLLTNVTVGAVYTGE